MDGVDHPKLGKLMISFQNPAKSQDRRPGGRAPMGGRGGRGAFGGEFFWHLNAFCKSGQQWLFSLCASGL